MISLAPAISNCDFIAISKRCDQGPLNGGVSNGGVSRSGLVLPFLSFLGLSRFFWDFPDLLGDGPGIFPIRRFSLSRPIKSTYEEQSRKGPRYNLDLARKKWETPRFSFSQAQDAESTLIIPSWRPLFARYRETISAIPPCRPIWGLGSLIVEGFGAIPLPGMHT